MKSKTKSIRFNCETGLLGELDEYRSRYVSRTQMLEQAIRNYIVLLKQKGFKKGGWQ
ncbi:MAG: hypothetical protein JKX71_15470 [Amylibacter sp.]|nr:hypothetical protein [Amylibacter sp.]